MGGNTLAIGLRTYRAMICMAEALNEANTEVPVSSFISPEDIRIIKAVRVNPQSRVTLTRGLAGIREFIFPENAFRALDEGLLSLFS